MQERAAVIGGTLTVESTPGVGTVVTLSVPRTQLSL
jgi:signal transduction histidine kinase